MTFRARLAEHAQGLKRELEVYRRVLGDARTPWLPKLLLGLTFSGYTEERQRREGVLRAR